MDNILLLDWKRKLCSFDFAYLCKSRTEIFKLSCWSRCILPVVDGGRLPFIQVIAMGWSLQSLDLKVQAPQYKPSQN